MPALPIHTLAFSAAPAMRIGDALAVEAVPLLATREVVPTEPMEPVMPGPIPAICDVVVIVAFETGLTAA